MLVPVSVLLSLAAAAVLIVDGGRDDTPACINSPITYEEKYDDTGKERRAINLECPAQAVCADEWNTIRDWYNGTRCKEQRIIKHCSCPGNTPCPIGSQDHAFYANKKHTQYLCEPRCGLEKCSTLVRPAMEMVQNSPEFDRNNFYRIHCRCRGHHFPLSPRPGQLLRSTSYLRVRFNFTQGITYTQYRCAPNMGLLRDDDPCGM